MKKLKV